MNPINEKIWCFREIFNLTGIDPEYGPIPKTRLVVEKFIASAVSRETALIMAVVQE